MPQRKQLNSPDDQQFATQIGARIQFLRLERGLSLRDVAARGGCSVSTVSSIEHGGAATSMNSLLAIAKALQVQPFDLLNHDTNDSDVGFLLEAMRQDPECVRIVNAQLSSVG